MGNDVNAVLGSINRDLRSGYLVAVRDGAIVPVVYWGNHLIRFHPFDGIDPPLPGLLLYEVAHAGSPWLANERAADDDRAAIAQTAEGVKRKAVEAKVALRALVDHPTRLSARKLAQQVWDDWRKEDGKRPGLSTLRRAALRVIEMLRSLY